MFEQEIEMEKRQSSVVPLLLIVGLIICVVGVAGYYAMESRKVVTSEQATTLIQVALQAQGPATVKSHTGMVAANVSDKPHDPNYRLLEKAGYLKLGKDTGQYGTITPVSLTPKGEQ